MSSNTAEFEALSTEAKTMVGAFWSIMRITELCFERPWIITPQARKGLDDLTAAGYLKAEQVNPRYGDKSPMVWKPTGKMKAEKPRVSLAFVEANSFPITDEKAPAKAEVAAGD
jgi:hypothetical protein